MANEFQCAQCERTFTRGWSDDEAAAEFRQNFGAEDMEEVEEVCDDCYAAIMEWWRSLTGGSTPLPG